MSVEEYKKWKAGDPTIKKSKLVIDFWETNPSMEQEEIVNILTKKCYLTGLSMGGMIGATAILFLFWILSTMG